MKKTVVLLIVVFAVLCSGIVFAGPIDQKKARDSFYSTISSVFSFSKADCKSVRSKGYSPAFAFVMLYIAKETGRPISELVALRDGSGYSMKDVCDKYNANYPAIMNKLKADIIRNKITFPPANSAEMKKNIVTVPKKGGDQK